REGAEGARRNPEIELGIAHRADGVAEALVVQRPRGHEIQLTDEDIATRELVDEGVQERDVLRLQRVPAGPERAHVLAILEEQAHLVGIHRQLAPEWEGLVGMFVDDLVLEGVVPRDHHALYATLDEIHDAHAYPDSCRRKN